MALDREKAFANAERLLKQGRASAALDEYRRIAEEAARDVLTLNRIGDVLARAGRVEDALVYYEKAGDHFAQAGFYPRAVAILKKVVKLDPSRLDVLVKLADLYLRQKLPGEARQYFIHAADGYLKLRQFAKTREVYERLVAADPSDLVNRVRLAEARAAEGDVVRAAEDLLLVAESMTGAGRLEDAERTYRRASELLPDRPEPVAGLAACLVRKGNVDEALGAVAAAIARRPADARLLGERLVLLESLGRHDEAAAFLAEPRAATLQDEQILRAFEAARARRAEDGLLARIEPVFKVWRAEAHAERAERLLDSMSLAVEGGWPPALDRLRALKAEDKAPVRTMSRVLERLIASYEAHGEEARAAELRAELTELAGLRGGSEPSPAETADSHGAGDPAGPGIDRSVSVTAEAPAVPLTPQDHEAVSGHITEAEVFLKYGLRNEALQQLSEAVRRFPGHVGAVERLVDVLGVGSGGERLRDALVTLALARRAAGDHAGARLAAKEAAEVAPLAPETFDTFAKLELIAPEEPPAPAEAAPPAEEPHPLEESVPGGIGPSAAPPRVPPPPVATAPPPVLRPAPTAPPARAGEELVIEFDGDVVFEELDPEPPPPPPPPPRARPRGAPARVVTPDMIEEIEFYIEQRLVDEARKKIAALRMLGFSGAELDDLERRAKSAPAPAQPVVEAVLVDGTPEEAVSEDAGPPDFAIDEDALDDVIAQARLDESDLSSIAESLDAKMTDVPGAAAPVPEAEQDLGQVFDEFKRQVEEEVGTGDFRTHYDLGIAYKEMGLVDDAIGEFRVAARAPELFRDSWVMMALCHRGRGEGAEAVECYRRAVAAPGDETQPSNGIRYDLAELLVEQGDAEGALDAFQEIMRSDPSFRDVRRRVAEMKSRLRR